MSDQTTCPDRTGQVWEEVLRPEHEWNPNAHGELERFVVVSPPRTIAFNDGRSTFYHPILWIDGIPDDCVADYEPAGVNERYFLNGWYTRLA